MNDPAEGPQASRLLAGPMNNPADEALGAERPADANAF
jgi:hypothetical protein